MKLFRASLKNNLAQFFADKGVLPSTSNSIIDDDTLLAHPDIVADFFAREYIDYGLNEVREALWSHAGRKTYKYISVNYQDADPHYWRLAIEMGNTS